MIDDVSNPTCPYCGVEWIPEEEDMRACDSETECPTCGKKFMLTANHIVRFDSKKKDCENGHEFRPMGMSRDENGGRVYLRTCANCDLGWQRVTVGPNDPCPDWEDPRWQ